MNLINRTFKALKSRATPKNSKTDTHQNTSIKDSVRKIHRSLFHNSIGRVLTQIHPKKTTPPMSSGNEPANSARTLNLQGRATSVHQKVPNESLLTRSSGNTYFGEVKVPKLNYEEKTGSPREQKEASSTNSAKAINLWGQATSFAQKVPNDSPLSDSSSNTYSGEAKVNEPANSAKTLNLQGHRISLAQKVPNESLLTRSLGSTYFGKVKVLELNYEEKTSSPREQKEASPTNSAKAINLWGQATSFAQKVPNDSPLSDSSSNTYSGEAKVPESDNEVKISRLAHLVQQINIEDYISNNRQSEQYSTPNRSRNSRINLHTLIDQPVKPETKKGVSWNDKVTVRSIDAIDPSKRKSKSERKKEYQATKANRRGVREARKAIYSKLNEDKRKTVDQLTQEIKKHTDSLYWLRQTIETKLSDLKTVIEILEIEEMQDTNKYKEAQTRIADMEIKLGPYREVIEKKQDAVHILKSQLQSLEFDLIYSTDDDSSDSLKQTKEKEQLAINEQLSDATKYENDKQTEYSKILGPIKTELNRNVSHLKLRINKHHKNIKDANEFFKKSKLKLEKDDGFPNIHAIKTIKIETDNIIKDNQEAIEQIKKSIEQQKLEFIKFKMELIYPALKISDDEPLHTPSK